MPCPQIVWNFIEVFWYICCGSFVRQFSVAEKRQPIHPWCACSFSSLPKLCQLFNVSGVLLTCCLLFQSFWFCACEGNTNRNGKQMKSRKEKRWSTNVSREKSFSYKVKLEVIWWSKPQYRIQSAMPLSEPKVRMNCDRGTFNSREAMVN